MYQTLEQRRARHAWEAVQRAKQGNDAKKYGGQAKKLPTRILTSGLGGALAFLLAKDEAPQLLEDLGDWVLVHRHNPTAPAGQTAKDALLRRIMNGDADFLRRTTDEVMAYLQWLRRFVDAEGIADTEES